MINEYVEKPKRMFMERCRGSYDVAKEPFSFRRKLFWCATKRKGEGKHAHGRCHSLHVCARLGRFISGGSRDVMFVARVECRDISDTRKVLDEVIPKQVRTAATDRSRPPYTTATHAPC